MSKSLVDIFEPPCDFTRQDELFPGTWIDDGSRDDLSRRGPCRIHYIEKLLTKLDRDADRREALKLVTTFDEKMTETIPNQMMMEMQQARMKRKPVGRIWGDDEPDGTMLYAETCTLPRPEFWSTFMKWRTFTLELRAFLDPEFQYELDRGDWD